MPDAEKIIADTLEAAGVERGYVGASSFRAHVAKHVAAALREAGMLTEQWEYGAGYQGDNGIEKLWFAMNGAFTVREAAENEVARYDDAQVRLIRRRKPGRWEPVEGDPR